MSRIYLSRDEQQAIHLAVQQYDRSAERYAAELDMKGTAIEHQKLATTLRGILKKASFYPLPSPSP